MLRGSDRVFRVGGEEFALMLETTDRDGVEELLERAREAVKALGVEPSMGSRLSARSAGRCTATMPTSVTS